MSATIVQGNLHKGKFQARPKTYISEAYRLQEDILKICVSNTVALDSRNEVFKNMFLEGTQLRRPLYVSSVHRNDIVLRA